MLRINRETDYAIRVILALARHPKGEIIPSAVIREEMGLPESLSLQIISHLANHEFINSYPGRNGGIQLANSPGEINLLDVIQAMEGPILLSYCLESDQSCQFEKGCPVRCAWIELQERIEENLAGVTFQILTSQQPHSTAKVVQ